MKNNLPKIKTTNIVVKEFEKKLLLYDLVSNKAFCLNETSAFIWQLCDGKNSIIEISRQLSKHFNANLDENFVWLAVEQFKRDELLDESVPIEIDFGGLSRRQVIKKVGLASMIALPLISSVIAPSAAMAQSSCVPPGSPNASCFDSLNSLTCTANFCNTPLAQTGASICCSGLSVLSFCQQNSTIINCFCNCG